MHHAAPDTPPSYATGLNNKASQHTVDKLWQLNVRCLSHRKQNKILSFVFLYLCDLLFMFSIIYFILVTLSFYNDGDQGHHYCCC